MSNGASPGRVAVFGLGTMGGAMAAHLVRTGFVVHGFDPDGAAMARAVANGMRPLAPASTLPSDTAVIVASLPSESALEDLVRCLRQAPPERAVLAETSTLSLEAKCLARDALAEAGVAMMDCPISGTGAQAQEADLSVYASGEPTDWDRLAPVLHAFARRPRYVGSFGAGTRLKFAANLLVAIHNVAAAEAMRIVESAAIDPALAIEVLSAGAGNSRVFELRAPLMARSRYEPATMKLGLWMKDLSLIASYLDGQRLRAPLFEATRPLYASAANASPLADTAAVYELLKTLAGRPADGATPRPSPATPDKETQP